MTRGMRSPHHARLEREALRRRVRLLYNCLNRERWEKCFSLVDPLREQSRVELPGYADRLHAFKEVCGSIRPWLIRISLHLDASSNKHDKRPFAYVYVIWQDERHGFHLFRERWVQHSGRWFTRVVGLVPNPQEAVQSQD
jgi:hypothetical protein